MVPALLIVVKLLLTGARSETEDNFVEYSKSCQFSETVNITDGLRHENGSIEHEGFIYRPEIYATYNYVMKSRLKKNDSEEHTRGCICRVKKCVRFCSKTKSTIFLPFRNETPETIDLDELNLTKVIWWPCPQMIDVRPGESFVQFKEVGLLDFLIAL